MSQLFVLISVLVFHVSSQVWELEALSGAAVCLDGTSAGFYHKIGNLSSSWIIHFQGGGYCSSIQDCYSRSFTDLGSSSNWPQSSTDGVGEGYGFLSSEPSVNPRLSEWTKVKVPYCDGAYFSGDRAEPQIYNGKNLFFRGKQIVQETFKTLLSDFDLGNATEIIITGCSAGGEAVFLHLDWIREIVPEKIRVVGAPDSGFFLDIPSYKGVYEYGPLHQKAFELHNATFGDSDCPFLGSEQYKCFEVQYVAEFVTTPMFVINSISDSYQLSVTLQLDCFHDGQLVNCTDQELTAVADFRLEMISKLKGSVFQNPENGAYLMSCLTHCGACTDSFWDYSVVQHISLQQAFDDWYFNHSTFDSSSILIDEPWPSNPCTFKK
jgi:hypothetical protein